MYVLKISTTKNSAERLVTECPSGINLLNSDKSNIRHTKTIKKRAYAYKQPLHLFAAYCHTYALFSPGYSHMSAIIFENSLNIISGRAVFAKICFAYLSLIPLWKRMVDIQLKIN